MPLRPALRLRLVDVGAASQKGFVVVGGMNAQRALFIGREVLPIALFEYQLGKGFSCLANIESLPAPAGCKQADTLQMGTCVDTNILGLKLPFIAFVGRHNPIRVEAHQLLAHTSDQRSIVAVVFARPRAGSPSFASNVIADERGGVVLLFRQGVEPVVLAEREQGAPVRQWLDAFHDDAFCKVRCVFPALPWAVEAGGAEDGDIVVVAGFG